MQFEEIDHEPVGAGLERFREAFFAALPDGCDRIAWQGLVHLAVRPRWTRVSDYDQSPPLIEETRFKEEWEG